MQSTDTDSINLVEEGEFLVIVAKGNLEAIPYLKIRDVYNDLYRQLTEKGSSGKLLIDFSEVTFLGSMMLGAAWRLGDRALQSGGQVAIAAPKVDEINETIRRFWPKPETPVCSSREEAISSLK